MQNILPLFVALPLGLAFLMPLLGRLSKRLTDISINIVTFLLFILSLFTLRYTSQDTVFVYKIGGWMPPLGICWVIDGLSLFMLITVNLITFLASLYSISYMEKFTAKPRFYTLLLLLLAGMNGVILTGDLFNLFVFYEIAVISSYSLVAFGVEDEELEASFKYQVLSTLASMLILFSIALTYGFTGSLNMADISQIIIQKGILRDLLFCIVLFLVGFGLKASLVPFHAWLADAHPSAPAPVSAILSGIFIKTVGVYALTRVVFNIFGISPQISKLLMFLGGLTACCGAFLALGQKDFKRLLAYSSISQIGYIIFGFGLNTPLGILGAIFHLFNHAVFKSLLFLNSGNVEYATGTRNLDKMGGLRESLPITANTCLVGSLSIAGIPPFSGFFSKLIIIFAAIQKGYFGYAVVLVLISILTLAYYLKLQMAFFAPAKVAKEVKPIPFLMQLSIIILALLCLGASFLMLPPLKARFLEPAAKALLSGTDYSTKVFRSIP